MNLEQINFLNKSYKIISMEKNHLIHPTAMGIVPLSKNAMHCSFSGIYHIEGYRLYLDRLTVTENGAEQQYDYDHFPVVYTGTVLAVSKPVKEYYMKSTNPACFSYQYVIELVFEKGILVTSIDQSRAMLRIRKNLELGLRCLTKGRDLRCIRRFLNSAFVGDYDHIKLPGSGMRYLKDMKKDYDTTSL